MNNRFHNLYRPPARVVAESGFSLIEMMISITIGLMIVAALVGVLVSNSSSSKTNDRTAELQINGRYALDQLRRELRHADYRGYTWVEPNTSSVTITNECLVSGAAAGSFVNNLSQGIWGANDSDPYAANCIPNADYVRGDVLVIRRVANAALTSPVVLVTGETYFRSTFTKGEMFQAAASQIAGTGTPNNTDGSAFGVPLADFLVQEYVYYIGNGGEDGSDTTAPALRRLHLRSGTMNDELVVSGVEQMQVQYARTTDGNVRYYDASEITTATEWQDVSSVRIWILARNSRPEQGYTNTNTYNMGDVTYDPVDDGFRRQLFSTVAQLRNFHVE